MADRYHIVRTRPAVVPWLIGLATVRNENGAILAEIAPCPINVVAGAGCGHHLPDPIRIQLGRA